MSRHRGTLAALVALAALGVASAPLTACNAVTGVGDYTFGTGGATSSASTVTGTGGTPSVSSTTTGGGGAGGGTGGTGGGGAIACPGGTPEECAAALGGEVPNGAARCEGGVCVAECDAKKFADCDGDFKNGCEVDLRIDPRHCGTCARACATTNVASLVCEDGKCTSGCLPGFVNCVTDAETDDGCEAPSDDDNCGSCGNDCGDQIGGTCNEGACACGPSSDCGPLSACSDGLCKCTLSNTTCAPGEACTVAGTCSCNGGDACGSGEVCCDAPAGCFDLQTSAASCGACGRRCAPGFTCAEGKCACAAGGNESCNAGSPGVCLDSGLCQCGSATCGEGQRCLADGSCG